MTLPRSAALVAALTLLLLCSTAWSAKPTGGNWWQSGDALPTGDGGPMTLPSDVTPCGDAATFDLFAGQSSDVGSVTIANDATTLYVTFQATGTNAFNTLHLWVGTQLANVPANPQGTPVPAQFPLHFDVSGGTTHTFALDLGTHLGDDFIPAECGTNFFVVAHAEVDVSTTDENGNTTVAAETAFGGSNPGDGPRWWYYMEYASQCCDDTPGTTGHFETAFAKGSWVWTTGRKSNPDGLDSLRLTKNRWGWAINVTETGTTTYDVWAGAGLNDTDRGVLVGTVTVDWDGTNATVTYDLDGTHTMSEIHVYAGDDEPSTIAPGQYGYTAGFDPYEQSATTTIAIDDVDDDGIWIVAHAVVFVTD